MLLCSSILIYIMSIESMLLFWTELISVFRISVVSLISHYVNKNKKGKKSISSYVIVDVRRLDMYTSLSVSII